MFLLLVVLILLFSCSNEKNKLLSEYSKEYKLYVIPDTAIAGEKIKIVYNSKHDSAIYKNFDSLYAFIQVNGLYESINYRIRLFNDHGIFYSDFILPNFANNIEIMIISKHIYKSREGISIIVNDSKKEPMKGALSYFILNSKSYSEALEYYNMNKKDYHDMLYRTASFWFMLIKNKKDINFVELSVDSLFESITLNSHSVDYEDFLSIVNSCLSVYTELKKWDKVEQVIDLLLSKYNGKMFNSMYFFTFDRLLKEVLINPKELYEIQKKIKKLIIADSTIILNQIYHRHSIMQNKSTEDLNIYDNTVKKIKIKIDKFDFFNYQNLFEIIYNLNISSSMKNIDELINITKMFLNKFDIIYDLNEWKDYSEFVSPGPVEGWKGILIKQLSEFYLKKNDTLDAINLMKYYVNNERLTQYNIGSLSIISKNLFNIFFSQNNFDESKEALKFMYKYQSPYSDKYFDTLQNKIKLLNYDTLNINEFVSFKRDSYIKLSKSEKEYLKNFMDINNIKDSTIFIFIFDDECPACNLGFWAAIDTLKKIKCPYKIILSSNNISNEDKNKIDKNIIIHKKPIEISTIFKMEIQPCLIVIRNDYITHRIKNITTSKSAYLNLCNQ